MRQKMYRYKRSDEWETPDAFFQDLDREFHFDLDVCASDENHKCDRYFTKEQDGLSHSWGGAAYGAIRHTAM